MNASPRRGRDDYRASLARAFPRRISALDTIVAFICIDLRRNRATPPARDAVYDQPFPAAR